MDRRRLKTASWTSHSLEETEAIGKQLTHYFSKSPHFFLRGDLGAGKTHLAKGMIQAWTNVHPHEVLSPTFVIQQIYEGLGRTVHHFDLYRLTSASEFFDMGFDESFSPEIVSIVEWPERLEGWEPPHFWEVQLTIISETSREITLFYVT